ncbi:MAG: methylamine utilization protein [Acidobacteriota bacterium]
MIRRFGACHALILLAAVLAPASVASAAVLSGQVQLVTRSGRPITTSGDVVVIYQPDQGLENLQPLELEIETRKKKFTPRVTVLPVGSSVRFPNRDPILHNVFSVSKGNAFDLGLYRAGAGETAVFETAGLVRVYCNVHQEMVAYVWVVETPHTTIADGKGQFRLEGLPDGPGTLTVWHERSDVKVVELAAPRALREPLRLRAYRPRVPKHLNKFGRSYGRSRRDRY